MKCPYCGSQKFGKITFDKSNTQYVLMTMNTETQKFNNDFGTPIDVYACAECKNLVLNNPDL